MDWTDNSQKKVQIADKYMKKCSTSLAVKKCKSQWHLDSISPHSDWLPANKTQTIWNSGKDVG
jgi:DNA replication protein DnaD